MTGMFIVMAYFLPFGGISAFAETQNTPRSDIASYVLHGKQGYYLVAAGTWLPHFRRAEGSCGFAISGGAGWGGQVRFTSGV